MHSETKGRTLEEVAAAFGDKVVDIDSHVSSPKDLGRSPGNLSENVEVDLEQNKKL